MLKRFAVAVFALVALSLTPAFAAEEATPTPAVETATAAAQSDCGATLDLSAEPQVCPAVQIGVPEPEFMARRGYCRCGCGATCTTDADCGPGGSCVRAISCC